MVLNPDPYLLFLGVTGLAVLGIVVIPRLVANRPLSLPIFYVTFGALVFGVAQILQIPEPLSNGVLVEKVTELGVILALMSAGLKLDRSPSVREWSSTWRLLGLTMPLTIAAAALLGWGVAAFAIPTAVLLGAVVAPTDPVLASEVQVEEPMEGTEEEPLEEEAGMQQEVQFALTSEAGLNDSLAFPFTYLAIVMSKYGVHPSNWIDKWVGEYVFYKLTVGLVAGVVLGWGLGRLVFRVTVRGRIAESVRGLEALGATLFIYGVTELINGYGFLAVFVGALVLRHYEGRHEYNKTLHDLAEKSEHLMMAFFMILFGGALATGLLDPLTPVDVAVALALVFLVRPLSGLVGLLGFDRDIRERTVMSFLGVRGLGSFFYLAYAMNEASFSGIDRLWALVGCVVLISVLVHGVTATPAVEWISRDEASG
ncbi:sodium:proton antiporter [halophilic archaeon]|nr:sodium:proton antiporter [halophilic archaeon]